MTFAALIPSVKKGDLNVPLMNSLNETWISGSRDKIRKQVQMWNTYKKS